MSRTYVRATPGGSRPIDQVFAGAGLGCLTSLLLLVALVATASFAPHDVRVLLFEGALGSGLLGVAMLLVTATSNFVGAARKLAGGSSLGDHSRADSDEQALPRASRLAVAQPVVDASVSGICQICGTETHLKAAVACGSCHTPHHSDCWTYNRGCSTYACPHRPRG